jgi:hypothetical protein
MLLLAGACSAQADSPKASGKAPMVKARPSPEERAKAVKIKVVVA